MHCRCCREGGVSLSGGAGGRPWDSSAGDAGDDGDGDDDEDGQDDVDGCYLWHNSYKENYVTHTRKNMLWGKPRSGKHTVMYSVHRSIVVKLVSEKLKTLSKTIKIRVKQLAVSQWGIIACGQIQDPTHCDDRSSVLVFIIWDRKIKKNIQWRSNYTSSCSFLTFAFIMLKISSTNFVHSVICFGRTKNQVFQMRWKFLTVI